MVASDGMTYLPMQIPRLAGPTLMLAVMAIVVATAEDAEVIEVDRKHIKRVGGSRLAKPASGPEFGFLERGRSSAYDSLRGRVRFGRRLPRYAAQAAGHEAPGLALLSDTARRSAPLNTAGLLPTIVHGAARRPENRWRRTSFGKYHDGAATIRVASKTFNHSLNAPPPP